MVSEDSSSVTFLGVMQLVLTLSRATEVLTTELPRSSSPCSPSG